MRPMVIVVIGLLSAIGATVLVAQEPETSNTAVNQEVEVTEALETKVRTFFANQIWTVLEKNCFECHGPEKQENDLRLDSLTTMLKSGDAGPVVVPGDPEASPLVHAIRYDGAVQMPPNGKLPDQSIAALTTWIRMGAPWFEGHSLDEDPSAAATASEPDAALASEPEEHWSFRKVAQPPLPAVQNKPWIRNEIDHFILSKLEQERLVPAEEADRRVLIRRLYFDLIGLPPTPKEVHAFVEDPSSTALEELVDRLLGDPRYGERWARYWLDLARYADTAGYEGDPERSHAWRYRDYVIDTLNNDKPFDLFIKEQIAGDEFAEVMGAAELPLPEPERVVALTFLRLAPFTEPRGDKTRHELLSEMTSTVSSVFLGLTVGCAQCHDHKYDPIPTKDFYRMKAFFATTKIPPPLRGDGMQLGGPVPAAFYRPGEKERMDQSRAKHEKDLRIDKKQFAAFQKALQEKLTTNREEPVELEDVKKAIDDENDETFSPEEKRQFARFARRIFILENQIERLQPLATSLTHTFGPPYGPGVPPTHVLNRGQYDQKGEVVDPGFLSCITGSQQSVPIRLDPFQRWPTRSRRMTLAQWIASPDNPLTARVAVNRLWQYHFGRGLVATPSDFGKLGALPTHPELLDWLADRFVQEKWSIKAMHRLMLTSSAYRQSSQHEDSLAARVDPENDLLWRFRLKRLEGEAVRDSILAVSGQLNPLRGGPPVFPPLPEGLGEGQKVLGVNTWETSHGADARRRSIYTFQRRALNMPMMDALDAMVPNTSCAQRRTSTTSMQALSLYNGPFVNSQVEHFAKRVANGSGDDAEDLIRRAFRHALSRMPTVTEVENVKAFFEASESRDEALVGLCRILLNSNEFIYID